MFRVSVFEPRLLVLGFWVSVLSVSVFSFSVIGGYGFVPAYFCCFYLHNFLAPLLRGVGVCYILHTTHYLL